MKVLIVNGSPRMNGNGSVAINEMLKVFETEGVDTEVIQVGNKAIRGCMACNACAKIERCVFNDAVNEVADKFKDADGLIVTTPVYYASANGTLISLLDRLFYSTHFDKTMKVGACFCSARRGGLTATFDELNKYFTICGMPVASSCYWNGIHGTTPGQAEKDDEGRLVARTLAKNMSFLMKSIALGKEKYGLPAKEEPVFTNFIR